MSDVVSEEGYAEFDRTIQRSIDMLRDHGCEYEAVMVESDLAEIKEARDFFGSKRSYMAELAADTIRLTEERFAAMDTRYRIEHEIAIPPRPRWSLSTTLSFLFVGLLLTVGLFGTAVQAYNEGAFYLAMFLSMLATFISIATFGFWSRSSAA